MIERVRFRLSRFFLAAAHLSESRGRCLLCNKKIVRRAGAGRPAEFCSGACRVAWLRVVNSLGMIERATKALAADEELDWARIGMTPRQAARVAWGEILKSDSELAYLTVAAARAARWAKR